MLPESRRQAIAFTIAVSLTVVIAVSWLSASLIRLNSGEIVVTKEDIEKAKTATAEPSPFSSLKESFSGVGESLNGIKDTLEKLYTSTKNQQ